MSLELDEVTHTYRKDGREYLGVTQILALSGISQYFESNRSEFAMSRGSAAHKATELDDLGQLDEASLDPRLAGYLSAWRAFKKESGAILPKIEWRLSHPVYGFAGTLDRAGKIGDRAAIVDIKTGPIMHWTGLQLAAYWILIGGSDEAANFANPLRLVVQLTSDGKYKTKEFSDSKDRDIFLAALAVVQWRKKNGF